MPELAANPDLLWFPPERPFTDEADVVASDLVPGDVIRFCRQDDPGPEAIVLELRDETIDILDLRRNPFIFGTATTLYLADRGLKPYTQREGTWNATNHTQHLGINVPLQFHDREEAEGIKKVMDGFDEALARFGVTPKERGIEALALEALVKFELEGTIQYNYQRDLRPPIKSVST